MGKLQGWYEGFSKLHPSTNNGLEAIKKTVESLVYTQRPPSFTMILRQGKGSYGRVVFLFVKRGVQK